MKIVVYGLTLTSAWGNGHATTYRALLKELSRLGHSILFIEKDVPWYRDHRDLPAPEFCSLRLYTDWAAEERALVEAAADADAIVIGSYFPDTIAATEALLAAGHGPLLFYDIDTPITIGRLRTEGRCEYLAAAHIPHYSAYLSFAGGPILQELETRFGSPRAVAFYCSVDAELYRATSIREEYRADLSYLGTYAADRQPKLTQLLDRAAALLPDHGFLVAGPMYPEDLQWAPNVRRLAHVAPPDHPAFYSSSRFTLNLTRSDMIAAGYSPSVRLFEAAACGAPMLSDHWDGLDHFFTPGGEILLPADAEETVRILRDLPESDRMRMGRRARERVLAEHTSAHRAREFEAVVANSATPARQR